MSKINHCADEGWSEIKFNDSKELERKVIRYALVYLKANFEEEDAEDLEIDDMVLDGMLSRMIKRREEQ
jgi:hypothetical protein